MRIPMILFAAALSTGASAQLVGGQLGGQVGGAIGGGAGTLGAAVGGAGSLDPSLPDAGRTIDRATDAAPRSSRRGKAVRVDAGASLRVDRGTRCYYDDTYYYPVYRDGYYYCERSDAAVGAGVVTGG